MSAWVSIFIIHLIGDVYGSLTYLTQWSTNSMTGLSSFVIGYDSSTNYIWLIGGWNSNVIYRYNINTLAFDTSTYGTLPFTMNMDSQSYTQMGNVIYFAHDNKLRTFNMGNQAITSITDFTFNDPNGGMHIPCLANDDRFIYVAGGASVANLNNAVTRGLFRYWDTMTDAWDIYGNAKPLIHARWRHSCRVYGGWLYAFSGQPFGGSLLLNMERVSISPASTIPNNFWNKTGLPAMSTTDNTYSHRNVLINDLIYIIGGGTSSYGPDNSVWVFDPNTLTLNKDNNMVYTHRNPSPIAADNKIYVFSGAGTGYNYYEISNMFPTKDPTEVPTKTPSISPSDTPTNIPTINPTITPTKIPTEMPTETPSISPTKSSNTPTISTDIPTQNPTITMNPTENPTLTTKFPTNNPTKITINPTINTIGPTSETIFPSIFPTMFPTITPSLTPTNNPSLTPSISPSFNPTSLPTQSPSERVLILPQEPDDSQLTFGLTKSQLQIMIIGCTAGCCIVILAAIAFYACYAKNKNLTERIKSLESKQQMSEINRIQSSSHVGEHQQPGTTTVTLDTLPSQPEVNPKITNLEGQDINSFTTIQDDNFNDNHNTAGNDNIDDNLNIESSSDHEDVLYNKSTYNDTPQTPET